MKILYQIPSLYTIYAGRTIYLGYKHAFEDLGHEFLTVTADDNFKVVLEKSNPDILITSMNAFNMKFLDLPTIAKQRKKGMKVFVNTPFWQSPLSKLRINEAPSLSTNKQYLEIIKSGTFGDVYYNVCTPGDDRMDGFAKETGQKHITIPLAADKFLHFPEYTEKFKADISFIGSNLPDKQDFFQSHVFPLKKKYDLKLYGQDWTFTDKTLNLAHKVGQFFNVPVLKSFKKAHLEVDDERRIYTSSQISINVHEEYQRRFGGDCNERTFKIPACAGFEITDDVDCIREYFKDGEEIVIAKNKDDWFEKIDYYLKNPQKRVPIIEKGKIKVLKFHTYHNRVEQIVRLFKTLK